MLIHVAAAAIFDSRGRVLLSQRARNTHQGGLWEFPGGKLETGETPRQALRRELSEELAIRVQDSYPLIRVRHDYGDREVLIDFFRVNDYRGEPRGVEGQPLRWVAPETLRPEEFPAADRPVITALRLPQTYAITGEDPTDTEAFLHRFERLLEGGVRLIQLRAHGLSDEVYAQLLITTHTLCRAQGASLIVNRPRDVTRWQGQGDGVHLGSAQLMALKQRPQSSGWVGASCHTLAELQHADALGLDYALLSPVLPTLTHPGVEALGWERFAEWVDQVNLPVFALGGVNGGNLSQACDAGGQGIAGIRALWNPSMKHHTNH
ncbi:MAG: Nudix family hydrolase [Candidatus Thiodiazotropha sp.]